MSQTEYLDIMSCLFSFTVVDSPVKRMNNVRGLSVFPFSGTQAGLDLSPGGSDRRCGEAAGFPEEGEGFPGSGPEC